MSFTLHHGDCCEVMKTFADCSIDSVVTDPPYGLQFMGKEWDKLWRDDSVADRKYVQKNDGHLTSRSRKLPSYNATNPQQMQAWHEVWARECFRVLKPGGFIVAFSGTRTYHRMATAIEDAGFEIRDMLSWLYGSGFPKSRNVGDGWGTALKPACEPICFGRKPFIGTIAENRASHGTGAINIDDCRVSASGRPAREVAAQRDDVVYDGNALAGRVDDSLQSSKAVGITDLGRWPANVVHDGSEEVLEAFPDNLTSGTGAVKKATGKGTQANAYGKESREVGSPNVEYGDTGSAARFFYTAKADAEDRFGSKHPTVKPVDLMQWLVRLVTPKGGTVLDPFAGTGTAGEAAIREGMKCILIEREVEYLKDIKTRMDHVKSGPVAREHARMKNSGKTEDAGPLFSEREK